MPRSKADIENDIQKKEAELASLKNELAKASSPPPRGGGTGSGIPKPMEKPATR